MGLILNPNESYQPLDLATSTIALSIYNILAIYGREMAVSQIYDQVCKGHNQHLPKNQFIDALRGLLRRRFLCIHHPNEDNATEQFSTSDRLHRLVRSRDRSGDGWDNWRLVNKDGSVQRLEDIINV